APLPPGGEQGQDLGDVGGELPLGDVIAGPVGEAHEVRVALDDPGHHGAAVQVDDLHASTGIGGVAHRHEAPVPDGHRADHTVGVVHRVDVAIDEDEGGRARGLGRR